MNTEEREISLLNLLIYVVKGWRGILLWMLIMAIAVSGVQYVREMNNANAAKTEVTVTGEEEKKKAELTLQQLREEMEEAEIAAVDKVIKLESEYITQQEYMKASALMNINPYDVAIGRIQYWVDTNYKVNYAGITESDPAKDIVSAYIEHLNSGEWKNTAFDAARIDIKPQYFNELFSIEYSGNSFTFIIKLGDEIQVETIIDSLKEEVEKYQKDLDDMFGKHELNLVNESVEISVDSGIYDLQQTKKNNLLSLEDSINNYKNVFSDNQKSLYTAETLIAYGDEAEDQKTKEKNEFENEADALALGVSMKYILLGAVLGAFLVCMVRAMRYILSGKLKAEDNVDLYLGVTSLGYIEEKKRGYKGVFGKLDRWIDGLAKRSYNDLSEEQQLLMVVSNIGLYCEKGGMKNIYFNSSVNSQTEKEDKIIKMLSQRGVSVNRGYSILQDASSMENMNKADGVVFFEQADKSQYEDVEREVKVCKEHEKVVIGMVVMV